jgi:hypothetical protein
MRQLLVACFVLPLALGSIACGSSPPPPAAAPAAPCPAATPKDDGLDKLTDEQVARKLLEVMGASQLGKQVADAMLENFRKMPQLPPGFIDRFKQNMHIEVLNDMVVGVYLKHLDRKAMTAAIRFYQSDEGRSIVAVLPVITEESMAKGREWGSALAKKTLKDLGVTQ